MMRNREKRDAKVIALFVLLLPALLGIVSLVIDAGIMLAMHRHAQSAADAGALAAARDLLANSPSTMSATAASIVNSCSNLRTAQVQVNCPPSQGNYAGNSQYVEVIVTVAIDTYFIQVAKRAFSARHWQSDRSSRVRRSPNPSTRQSIVAASDPLLADCCIP